MTSELNNQLQKLAVRLQELNRAHPENNTVKDALALLSTLDSNDPRARSTAWHAIEADLDTLRFAGVWSLSQEDEELLKHLKTRINCAGGQQSLQMSRRRERQKIKLLMLE